MSTARLSVEFAGPHVSIQDAGRPGYMRFGVPVSGPLDRLSFVAANAALGNPLEASAIEVSMGGLVLRCTEGSVTFAVAGGGFLLEHGDRMGGSWSVRTLRAGERLSIKRGHWGCWTYLAFSGKMSSASWLGSASTHAMSGFGGGRLQTGDILKIEDAEVRIGREGSITCPVTARPRSTLRAVLGPQDRFFDRKTVETLFGSAYQLTDSYDRMGVRLRGPSLLPAAPLDMPSEPIVRGAVQVAGDGVPTVLLADHQTTGGYPKIATVIDSDLDAFCQLRPRDVVRLQEINPDQSVTYARLIATTIQRYLSTLQRYL